MQKVAQSDRHGNRYKQKKTAICCLNQRAENGLVTVLWTLCLQRTRDHGRKTVSNTLDRHWHMHKKKTATCCLNQRAENRLVTVLWTLCLQRTRDHGRKTVSNTLDRHWHMHKKRQLFAVLTKERKTRLELATPTLARLCSTN